MAVATKKAATGVLEIPPLVTTKVILRIVGDSELITHNWSEKAKKEMRDKQMKKATVQKAAKDPDADYEGAFYRLPDGSPALRTIAFKASAVDAATQIKALTKVYLRGAFHTLGELVKINGEPYMREDMVRVGMGTADLRYRPGFPDWSVDLPIRFNPNAINLEQIIHLFNQAGFSCGVGEWRPQKDGPYGMFHVESVMEV